MIEGNEIEKNNGEISGGEISNNEESDSENGVPVMLWELLPEFPTELINEHQALNLLEPVDQTYSSNISLTGIRNIYRSIVKATNAFFVKFRANPVTFDELYDELKGSSSRFGSLENILAYLTQESDDSYHSYIAKYYSIVIKEQNFSLVPVYFAGPNDLEQLANLADEAAIVTAFENAYIERTWKGRDSHLAHLAEKIKENKIGETYFLGSLQFPESDEAAKTLYEKRILPRIKNHEGLLYFDPPHIFVTQDDALLPVILIQNNVDVLDRYEYLTKILKKFAEKIYNSAKNNSAKKEDAYRLRSALDDARNINTPENNKKLAEAVLTAYKNPDSYRQMALEVFLIKDEAQRIIKWKEEVVAAEKQKQLDLLVKRIRARQWLILIPASFYAPDTFKEALTQPGILGVRKRGDSLGLDQDYYACIEVNAIEPLLRTANFFELAILEEILKAYSMASRDLYKKKIFERKKNILFLILNPVVYFLKSLFGLRKKFIEDEFAREIERKGAAYISTMGASFIASGINSKAENREASADPKENEKKRLTEYVMSSIFPDPSPSALTISDLEYRERLNEAARNLYYNPEFPQYSEKNIEAIMGDIDTAIRSELIEEQYQGPLPSGTTKTGKPFSRKTFAPRYIIDQPLIYNSIREEYEHESAIYGSKDLVDYYRSKAKIFSESNMENLRQKTKLARAADKRRPQSEKQGDTQRETQGVDVSAAAPSTATEVKSKPPKKSFFSKSKSQEKREQKKKSAKDLAKKAAAKKANQKKANKEEGAAGEASKDDIIASSARRAASRLEEKYVTNRKFGGSLYPLTRSDMEDLLNLPQGNLSVFTSKNAKRFSEQFVSIKVGYENYYFPKRFFVSRRHQIARYYEDLVKHEEGLALPNGDILRAAHDIAVAVRSKK